MYRMQVFKGTIFCCVRFCRRKCYNICYFHISMFTFGRDSFSFKIDLGVLENVPHILKNMFYQKLVQIKDKPILDIHFHHVG